MPIGVALTLMMIARRMKAADVLPKSLATVEMLGCINAIASDKSELEILGLEDID